MSSTRRSLCARETQGQTVPIALGSSQSGVTVRGFTDEQFHRPDPSQSDDVTFLLCDLQVTQRLF
ncbi:MAG: hypothetical protein GY935_17205 [Gammaproteobacteria bacterium]|nr:hypothetical protein [Gammaproteobacteria bacterium]